MSQSLILHPVHAFLPRESPLIEEKVDFPPPPKSYSILLGHIGVLLLFQELVVSPDHFDVMTERSLPPPPLFKYFFADLPPFFFSFARFFFGWGGGGEKNPSASCKPMGFFSVKSFYSFPLV